MNTQQATFAAGCFWGVEAAFRKLDGVIETSVGYSGGHLENPTYEQVCTGRTGHAETVRVEFDPEVISYEQLLDTFWNTHDPTQKDRQGPDVGSQYRSVVFTHDQTQAEAAEASKTALETSGKYSRPIATTIEPAPQFFMAEDCHQQYIEKRGLASCRT
jgi:peptide-methionine (S)-S-oxide reductase